MNAHLIILVMLLAVLGFSIAAVMHKTPAERYVQPVTRRPQVVASTQSQAAKCATRRAECNSKSGAALATCRSAMAALGC